MIGFFYFCINQSTMAPMKAIKYLVFVSLFFIISCKKDKVDGSSVKTFQSSINDMASTLSTIRQIKFQEALYIIKTYGTTDQAYMEQMNQTAALLNGKNLNAVFSIADSIAAAHNVEWSSKGTPSLGEMNIFDEHKPTEIDPNDISASALAITVQPVAVDSVNGPQALMIIPRLQDRNGKNISFTNATLEATLEIMSGGVKILTSRNFMTNNNFKGFYLKLQNLPASKVMDNKIDAKITVKTKKDTFEMTKSGISVNPNSLQASATESDVDAITSDSIKSSTPTPISTVAGEPSATVSKFLSNINANNLKAAYAMSNNPAWGSYDAFSNPSSGFGAVKNIKVNTVKTNSKSTDQAQVNASYNVTDQQGNNTTLNVTYTLKASVDGWKITGYKINSTN